MKKNVALAILTAVVLLFAACSGNGSGSGLGGGSGSPENESGGASAEGSGALADTLTGTTADIIGQVVADANAALGEANAMPPVLTDPVTAENAGGLLGLSEETFVTDVAEATVSTGALMTNAFEVALVKCTDAKDAVEVKAQIAGGFDSGKWICVAPEQSLTVSSGSYVLLAVGRAAETEALAEAFKAAAGGSVSETDVFYKGEANSGASGGAAAGGLALN